jgi:ArsR family transcriptional regulator
MSLDRFPADTPVFQLQDKPESSGSIARDMVDHAEPAAALLKALSHSGRLMILCHLAGGEKSVTELETLLGQRQAAVSQQLARLRLEGLVSTRRHGKTIYYAIQDTRVTGLLSRLPGLFVKAA